MKSEWNTSAIANICKVVTDGSHTSPKSVSHGKYMVSVKDFTPYGFDFNGCRQISFADYEKLKSSGCVPQKGDILIGKDGARYFEDIIIYNQDEAPALLSSIAILRCDEEKVISEYLYYLLKTPSFKKDVKDNYGSGSAIPRIILKDFKRMKVEYPSIEKQRQIVSILHDLDAKIFNNQKVNDNLLRQAQALYKNRFIDLKPFNGEMPPDWQLGTVSEIIELHDSKRIPLSSRERANLTKIYPYYGATSVMDYVDSYLFDGIYLLLGEDGTVVDDKGFPILQYVEGKFWVNNHAHIITGKNGFTVETLYLLFSLTNVRSIVTGAVQPKISQANLNNVSVVIPSKAELSTFNSIVQPIFSQIRNLRAESDRLTATRDILLPRLMSGEIDATNIQL